MTRHEFNRAVIDEFRANGGRVGGTLAGTPIVLVHDLDADSGAERITPLGYRAPDDGGMVIAASNGGARRHPRWCHNLRAHPDVIVEVGAETFRVTAHELTGADHDDAWTRFVAAVPHLDRFRARAGRPIPLFRLTRAMHRQSDRSTDTTAALAREVGAHGACTPRNDG